MGKILDEFMKFHELDDAQVLAMIGNSALMIIEPDLLIEKVKKDPPPESLRKEAETLVYAATFASLAALASRFGGGK